MDVHGSSKTYSPSWCFYDVLRSTVSNIPYSSCSIGLSWGDDSEVSLQDKGYQSGELCIDLH